MTRAGVLLGLLVCLLPHAALAHTSAPGLAGFTAAMVHVTTEGPSPLALAGLGLLLGLLDEDALGPAFASFAGGVLLGLGLTLSWRIHVAPELPLVAIALLAGLSAASAMLPQRWVVAAVAVLAGYFFGVIATPDPAPIEALGYSVAGGVVGVCWVLMGIAAAVQMARQRWSAPWLQIGLRVIGSWIAAISALLLALLLAAPGSLG